MITRYRGSLISYNWCASYRDFDCCARRAASVALLLFRRATKILNGVDSVVQHSCKEAKTATAILNIERVSEIFSPWGVFTHDAPTRASLQPNRGRIIKMRNGFSGTPYTNGARMGAPVRENRALTKTARRYFWSRACLLNGITLSFAVPRSASSRVRSRKMCGDIFYANLWNS